MGETEILFPVPTAVPPQEPENHSMVAPSPTVPPLTVNEVESPLQIVVVPVMFIGAMEEVFTVTN